MSDWVSSSSTNSLNISSEFPLWYFPLCTADRHANTPRVKLESRNWPVKWQQECFQSNLGKQWGMCIFIRHRYVIKCSESLWYEHELNMHEYAEWNKWPQLKDVIKGLKQEPWTRVYYHETLYVPSQSKRFWMWPRKPAVSPKTLFLLSVLMGMF